jgi:multiple sugar transport system substrate-binding protein
MTHDYPSVKYRVVQLAAGRAGMGTLQYDGGWGMAAASKNKAAAMSLISYLTLPKVQLGNARAFGVMPSVTGVAKTWSKLYPQFAAYLAGANYSKSIPNVPGIATVLGDFNQQLQALPTTDAKTILDRINRELQAILNQS